MEEQDKVREDEINLLDLVKMLLKHIRFITIFAFTCAILTAIISLMMTNSYESTAVIMPVSQQGTGSGGSTLSALSQLGGGLGISMPASNSGQEVLGLLQSRALRERMIERYKLMPVLFAEKWDEKKQNWKEGSAIEYMLKIPEKMVGFVRDVFISKPKGLPIREGRGPTMWDALRALDGSITVKEDLLKENTITITVAWKDPAVAAKMVEYLLVTLMDYMSAEAKRVAVTNQKTLEQEINKTADPVIRQNLYNVIAQHVQASLLAETKENFAFKVIDPPKIADRKSRPRRSLMTIATFVVSLFLAVFIVFIKEYLEKNEEARTMVVSEREKLKGMYRKLLIRFRIIKNLQ